MVIPDYSGNSLVNLMSSILFNFGGDSPIPKLSVPLINDKESCSNIVLIVIDGLGYNFLSQYGKDSFIYKYLNRKLTSVFPSTTAAAMTSFYTGLTPKNHGVISWFTYLRELGLVSTILPFLVRATQRSIVTPSISAEAILNFTSLFATLNIDQYSLLPKKITQSPYSEVALGHTHRVGYTNINNFFTKIYDIAKKQAKKQVKDSNSKSFTLAYWPEFDTFAHLKGIHHSDSISHFKLIDTKIQQYIEKIKKISPKTKIIITADHGLVDTTPEQTIFLEDHPKLYKMLSLPLSGEPRAPFFYVRPHKINEFLEYIKNNFGKIGKLHTGTEVIEMNYFGINNSHPEFENRIGDYVFFLDSPYILKDVLIGEKRHDLIGNHGGISEDEMYVPLIVI